MNLNRNNNNSKSTTTHARMKANAAKTNFSECCNSTKRFFLTDYNSFPLSSGICGTFSKMFVQNNKIAFKMKLGIG